MLLRVVGVETLYFDRLRALQGVSLEVGEGEAVAVLGPNGAGKTTLLRTIAGLLDGQPQKGIVELDGRPIERRPPEAVARLGVVYVPEDRGLFRELTVRENLELGLWGRGREGADAVDQAYALFPALRGRERQQAETLSGGEQQMVAIARALLRRPRLLMLDEPSLGLAPPVAQAVFAALGEVSRQGTAILVVEQNARLAFGLAHRAAVLEAGRVVLQGTPAELSARDDVRDLLLGLAGTKPAVGWRAYRPRRRW